MTTPTDPIDWSRLLLEQLTQHWADQLRPRLEGLTDEEYLFEPVAGCWSVRPRGVGPAPIQAGSGEMMIDFAMPEPDPPPVTTIAWRIGHLVVGVFGARNHSHFAGPAADYMGWDYPATAAAVLEQPDGRARPAHQPGGDPSQCRDRPAARSLRPPALTWIADINGPVRVSGWAHEDTHRAGSRILARSVGVGRGRAPAA